MRIGGIGNMRFEVYRLHAHMNLVTKTAKVVYGEAGGVKEDEERLWIAHVVKNRYKLRHKYQFNPIEKDFLGYKRWEDNWKNGKIKNNPLEKDAWEKSLEAARKAWTSKHDPTKGAAFFVGKDARILEEKGVHPYDAKRVGKDIFKLRSHELERVKHPKENKFAHVFTE